MKLAYRKNAWPPVLHDAASSRILLTGSLAAGLAWRCRPRFLDAGPFSKTLFAGPWLGEFGWELLNWQGLIRALRPLYEHVIVCSRSSSRDLYSECCDEFLPHEISCRPNCHAGLNIEDDSAIREILNQIPKDADHLPPLAFVPPARQSFVPLGRPRPELSLDVLVHARSMPSVTDRNWPESSWLDFLSRAKEKDWSVGAVGLSQSTLALPGVVDCRDTSLQETMDRMASSRLVIGPSSGPMHLASLCAVPHLVWTDQQTYSMKKTSREKYEVWWNPLQTPVTVLDDCNFNPSVDQVVSAVEALRQTNR